MYVVFYAVYATRKEIMIYECCVFICHQEGDNDICMLCVHTVYATRKEIMIYVCCVFIQYMPPRRR